MIRWRTASVAPVDGTGVRTGSAAFLDGGIQISSNLALVNQPPAGVGAHDPA